MYDKISTNRVKKYNIDFNSQVDFQKNSNLLEEEYKKMNKEITIESSQINNTTGFENYNNLLGHYFREKSIFERDTANTTSK